MNGTLAWILGGGLLMSLIALVGGLTTLLQPQTQDRLLLPLIALAAGTLLGGALFHIAPQAAASLAPLRAMIWLAAGFAVFLALEQFLSWHHAHLASAPRPKPMTYLILIGDACHNLLGGLGIASVFLIDPRAGIVAWFAAAAHEIPQELGDFAILLHGGWPRRRALLWNFISALTFPLGALLACFASQHFDVAGFALFSAGTFVYIAASDLIPEIKMQPGLRDAATHYALFAAGLGGMLVLALVFAD